MCCGRCARESTWGQLELHLLVERDGCSGQQAGVFFPCQGELSSGVCCRAPEGPKEQPCLVPLSITPGLVRAFILCALEAGWDPESRGATSRHPDFAEACHAQLKRRQEVEAQEREALMQAWQRELSEALY